MFNLELHRIITWIKDRGVSSVAIQLPEGLKIHAMEISDVLNDNTGSKIIILGYPCYGACDIFIDYKKYADALVHFGHSSIPSQGFDENILYIEAKADLKVSDKLSDVANMLPEKIGILATIQYIDLIPDVKEILEKKGKTIFVGKGDNRISYPGQVLGCNHSSAASIEKNVDAFLFIGEGDFHPLAALFGVKKKVLIFNPITNEIRNVDEARDRILRKRFAIIENSKTANSFLIIICGKIGQCRDNQANQVMDKIKDAGKKSYKILLDEITPESLLPYKVDAYVNTACPRIAMDDSTRYSKPMLTIPELDIVLGLKEWEDYHFDYI